MSSHAKIYAEFFVRFRMTIVLDLDGNTNEDPLVSGGIS
jgi:hypothetical protein